MWIAGRPATDGRTFGYCRAEILAAVANAVLLVGVAAFILVSAIGRLDDPPEVAGRAVLALGVVGLVANGGAVVLLRRSAARLAQRPRRVPGGAGRPLRVRCGASSRPS